MQNTAFRQWLEQLPGLNQWQRQRVEAELTPPTSRELTARQIEQANAATRCCPNCQSTRWYRHGQAHGLQRYRCRACGRTYNDLSNTPLAGLHRREFWLTYFNAMQAGQSIRVAAKHTGVHRNTSFRWRHRFAQQLAQEQALRAIKLLSANTYGPPRPG